MKNIRILMMITCAVGIIGVDEKGRPANFNGMTLGSGVGLQLMISNSMAIFGQSFPEWHISSRLKPKGSERYKVESFYNFMLLNSFGVRYYL